MKLTESEKLKVKLFTKKLVEHRIALQTPLIEAFASKQLAQFASELSKFKTYFGDPAKLLKGIKWDLIPDSIISVYDGDNEQLRKLTNSDENLIIWFANEKITVKHNQTTYSKYGSSRDNSVYLQPGKLIVTVGRKFLYGHAELLKMKQADNKYDKPLDGQLSVGSMRDYRNVKALVIPINQLKKYSSEDLRNQRSTNKTGATALMNVSSILRDNQYRYSKAIKQAKLDRKSSEVDNLVTIGLEKLKERIAAASNMSFENLVTYSKSDYKTNPKTNLEVPSIKKLDFTKLEELASTYRRIVYLYDSYIDDLSRGYGNPEREKADLMNILQTVG